MRWRRRARGEAAAHPPTSAPRAPSHAIAAPLAFPRAAAVARELVQPPSQRRGVGRHDEARDAVLDELERAAGVGGGDHGLGAGHGLDRDEAVVLVQRHEGHGERAGVEARQHLVAHEAEELDPRVAARDLAQPRLLGAGAGDLEAHVRLHVRHGAHDELDALRPVEAARREEVVVGALGEPLQVRRVVRDDRRNAGREVARAAGDVARDGGVARDRRAREADAVEVVHHLAGERAGEGERAGRQVAARGQGEELVEEAVEPVAAPRLLAHRGAQPPDRGVERRLGAVGRRVPGVVEPAQPVLQVADVARVGGHPGRVLRRDHDVEAAEVEGRERGVAPHERDEVALRARQLHEVGHVRRGLVHALEEPPPQLLGAAHGEGVGAGSDDADPQHASDSTTRSQEMPRAR